MYSQFQAQIQQFCYEDRFHQSPHVRGTLNVLTSIYAKEGLAALWKGVRATVVGVMPSRAIYFSTYAKTKQCPYRQERRQGRRIDTFVSGSCCGCSHCHRHQSHLAHQDAHATATEPKSHLRHSRGIVWGKSWLMKASVVSVRDFPLRIWAWLREPSSGSFTSAWNDTSKLNPQTQATNLIGWITF